MIYLLFALVTGFYSLFMHFIPTVRKAEQNGHTDDEIIQNKTIAYVTYFCLAFIAAPLVFITVINPSSAERFKKGMYNTFTKKDS